MYNMNLVNFIPNALRLPCFEDHIRCFNSKAKVISDEISVFTLLITNSWLFSTPQQTLNTKQSHTQNSIHNSESNSATHTCKCDILYDNNFLMRALYKDMNYSQASSQH